MPADEEQFKEQYVESCKKAHVRYGDADEFDRETDPNGNYVGHRGSHSDWVYIPFQNHVYRITEAQAFIRNIHFSPKLWKEDYIAPPIPQVIERKKIHILDKGSALCGLPGRPVDWPRNHEWLSVEAQNATEACNCIDCIYIWKPSLKR